MVGELHVHVQQHVFDMCSTQELNCFLIIIRSREIVPIYWLHILPLMVSSHVVLNMLPPLTT